MSDAPNAMVRPSRLPKIATPAAVATRMPASGGTATRRKPRREATKVRKSVATPRNEQAAIT
jgi:hypothetical protein